MLDSLRDNAYGMYLIHYAFVSWLQYALLKATLPAIAKGSVGFLATLALSWSVTAVLRRIPAVAELI
jgi:surface polysaccharide O-acyltransferase-like enzyme